jgi:hypothetical protein
MKHAMATKSRISRPPLTHNTPGLPSLTEQEQVYVESAREALASIRKTFDFWVAIARGLKALHDKADQLGGKKTYDRLREREGLGRTVINKTRSSRLLAIIDNLTEVGKWRDGLTERQRFAWASPEAVHRHCAALKTPKDGSSTSTSTPWPSKINVEHAIDELHEHLQGLVVDERMRVLTRLTAPFNLQVVTMKKPPKGKKAKAKPAGKNELIWKDIGNTSMDGEHHSYEAPAAVGLYTIRPFSTFPSMNFGGYEVEHCKDPTAVKPQDQQIRLIKVVRTAEKAKAIAQADHDAGNASRR